MAIPRLRIDDTALIVVDMQERLVPTIIDRARLVANCAIMLRMVGQLGLPHLVTEHYPNGLGRTVDELTSVMIDASLRVEKTRFSACVDLVEERLTQWQRSSLLICGIEAHVCVAQTVLDFQAAGRQCFVVSDAIASSQPDQVAHALRRMEAAGAVTTGVMACMYELLGDTRRPGRASTWPGTFSGEKRANLTLRTRLSSEQVHLQSSLALSKRMRQGHNGCVWGHSWRR
jgi:nicotinamidase-related amidase